VNVTNFSVILKKAESTPNFEISSMELRKGSEMIYRGVKLHLRLIDQIRC
jgi:hypothetical protein